jgi:hypothetical protein
MTIYNHTQHGYVTGSALGAGAVVVYLSFQAEQSELGWFGGLLTAGFALGAVLFSSLTVQVDADELRFYFGPGFWERRIPISDIRSVEAVRNAAYYGWGIRYTVHGWLYNVAGLQAVELDVKDEGTIRVGTDEPEALKQALEQARQAA